MEGKNILPDIQVSEEAQANINQTVKMVLEDFDDDIIKYRQRFSDVGELSNFLESKVYEELEKLLGIKQYRISTEEYPRDKIRKEIDDQIKNSDGLYELSKFHKELSSKDENVPGGIGN